MGCARERAGTKHEHEAAVAGVSPLDLADPHDSRVDDASEDIEPHQIADGDPQSIAANADVVKAYLGE